VTKKKDFSEAAGFAAGGSVLGAGIASVVGNMGLAGAFGGIAISATPVIAAGTIVGMAAYGMKKIFD
jgi:PPE-repeat protein